MGNTESQKISLIHCLASSYDEAYMRGREKGFAEGYLKGLGDRTQGTWVKTGQSFVDPNKFRNFMCSVCKTELDEHIRIAPKFCSNCGAIMDNSDPRGKLHRVEED